MLPALKAHGQQDGATLAMAGGIGKQTRTINANNIGAFFSMKILTGRPAEEYHE